MGAIKPKVKSHSDLVDQVKRLLLGEKLQVKLPFGDKFDFKAYKTGLAVSTFFDLMDDVIEKTKEDSKAKGKEISCGPSCGNCCYQTVEASMFEAITISLYMDENQEIKEEFLKKYQGWRKGIGDKDLYLQAWQQRMETGSREGLDDYITKQFQKKIACPWLKEDSCSIYPVRPMVCRMVMTADDPSACASGPGVNMIVSEGMLLGQDRAVPLFGQLAEYHGLGGIASGLAALLTFEFSHSGEDYIKNIRGMRV